MHSMGSTRNVPLSQIYSSLSIIGSFLHPSISGRNFLRWFSETVNFDSVSHLKFDHMLSGSGRIPWYSLILDLVFLFKLNSAWPCGSSPSYPCTISSGTLQGSVNGPLLFNLFINDISDIIDSTSTIKIFADDVKIYTNIDQYYHRFLAFLYTCKPVWNTAINGHKYGNCQFLTPNATWSIILGHADILPDDKFELFILLPQNFKNSHFCLYWCSFWKIKVHFENISKIPIFVYNGVHFECIEPILKIFQNQEVKINNLIFVSMNIIL